jgi:hypothetical protein
MAEVTGLKVCHRGFLQWHEVVAKFHENISIVSKVIISGGTWANGQADSMVISQASLSFLKGSRLKSSNQHIV